MSLGWTIYIITRLDAISSICIVIAALSSITAVISGIAYVANSDFDRDGRQCDCDAEKAWPIMKWGIIICLIFTPISVLIPTSKTMSMIYVLPKIANNEDVKKIPSNIAKLANEALEDMIKKVKE